jgi:hypothetical protein
MKTQLEAHIKTKPQRSSQDYQTQLFAGKENGRWHAGRTDEMKSGYGY